MTRYGIIDIGSNTIVLVIYSYQDQKLTALQNCSQAVGLINYTTGGHLSQAGIDLVKKVLLQYRQILHQMQVERSYAFITEPARGIDNLKDALSQFEETGVKVKNISGKEEAECDFYGSRVDCGDVAEGLLADIGGGSTELVAYAQQKILASLSIPVGCVRFASHAVDESTAVQMMEDAARQQPVFQQMHAAQIIGVGGTIRALQAILDALYNTGNVMRRSDLAALYDDLSAGGTPAVLSVLRKHVKPDRQELILPGLTLLLDLCHSFPAETIRVSRYGVREGFLLHNVIDRPHGSAEPTAAE